MGVAAGVFGLALAAMVIGACGEPQAKDADAFTCAAYLPVQHAAVVQGRAFGNAAELEAAAAFWWGIAREKYSQAELAQVAAASAYARENVSVADLELMSTVCVANLPVA